MRFVLLILLSSAFQSSAQQDILYLLNTDLPIEHSEQSIKILNDLSVSPDSANASIYDRVKFCTFLANDTSKIRLEKRSFSELGIPMNQAYNIEEGYTPYRRPDANTLSRMISGQHDFIVTLNRIRIMTRFGKSKIQFWFTLFNTDFDEIISSTHTEPYDIRQGIRWNAYLHVLWDPCEHLETRILSLIDLYQHNSLLGTSREYLADYSWSTGEIKLTSGDVIKGEVRTIDPYRVSFRLSSEGDARLLESNEVVSYNSGVFHYESIFIHRISGQLGKHAFARIICSGNIDMLVLGDGMHMKYYVRKDDELVRLHLAPDKSRITNKEKVKSFFGPDFKEAKRMDDKRFGVKDLEKLIDQFNRTSLLSG